MLWKKKTCDKEKAAYHLFPHKMTRKHTMHPNASDCLSQKKDTMRCCKSMSCPWGGFHINSSSGIRLASLEIFTTARGKSIPCEELLLMSRDAILKWLFLSSDHGKYHRLQNLSEKSRTPVGLALWCKLASFYALHFVVNSLLGVSYMPFAAVQLASSSKMEHILRST